MTPEELMQQECKRMVSHTKEQERGEGKRLALISVQHTLALTTSSINCETSSAIVAISGARKMPGSISRTYAKMVPNVYKRHKFMQHPGFPRVSKRLEYICPARHGVQQVP